MNDKKYYYCTVCGNVIEIVHDSKNIPMCCMREMEELEAAAMDGKLEYHVPVCKVRNHKVKVQVGEQLHPMEKNHYIEWIELVTTKGIHRRYFCPGEEPIARFRLCDKEEILNVYAFCNLHKLWRCESPTEDDDEYDRYTGD